MRICQLLPTLSAGDAVGNEARAIRDLLAGAGYETGIYAEKVDPLLPAGTGYPMGQMPELTDGDILLYHLSTGTRLNRLLPKLGGRKVIRYHNITPPEFFRHYSPRAYRRGKAGYEEMRFLADKTGYVIAVSGYNREQLRENGYTCPIDVCPLLISFSDYDTAPDPKVTAAYGEDDWTNLLFVGRIVPNKKQEDVIRAYACYRRRYNPKSRLILAGSARGMERYEGRLRSYVKTLGVEDGVIFTGYCSFEEILAWYRAADAFVCMSGHEGFCVPLAEAMYFGVPIVAYRTAAVPETAGNGALLLDSRDPETAAAAIHRTLTDGALKAYLLAEQEKQLAQYSYDNVRKRMLACLAKEA